VGVVLEERGEQFEEDRDERQRGGRGLRPKDEKRGARRQAEADQRLDRGAVQEPEGRAADQQGAGEDGGDPGDSPGRSAEFGGERLQAVGAEISDGEPRQDERPGRRA